MLQDLDATLAELLKAELPASLVQQVAISFATPDGEFPPASVSLPAINVFLYDLQENRELRTNDTVSERGQDGTVVRHWPPVRLDCHYLITAWGKPGAGTPEQDEHRILGEALRALLRHRFVPAAFLQGSMRDQPLPIPTSALRASPQQSRGDFWQALGGKPKAAINYVVTIAVDAHEPEVIGTVVQSVGRGEAQP